ncbi:hypothetical protein [Flavobacterium agrisoli]|uniref:Uncharacterized protein n=1 Tax=Flavobacterium agrisoli TaxID=2793066 RepID=A0A934UJN6_9FLAO|nr:hypothetical protein [Flavobacterium agrisoli]MBK0370082.1 hypothetical protein [Flavobacterium agrisoli]
MKSVLLSLLFIFYIPNYRASEVYICGAKGANKYHYSERCRGLSACSHEVKKVTLKEAQGYGLTLYGWED